MKLRFTKAQIKDIATHLNGDDRCYIHPETGEIVFWPDFEEARLDHEKYLAQLGEKRRTKYEESVKSWIPIHGTKARDEIRMMESFVPTVTANSIRTALSASLVTSKPFAHFRAALNSSEEWLQKWLDYKEAAFAAFVIRQIEAHESQPSEAED
jgi:Uncharacterised protein family (UPF0158)